MRSPCVWLTTSIHACHAIFHSVHRHDKVRRNTLNEFTILLAHGSSDPDWGATFERMTHALTSSRKDVKLAFMELSTPSMEEVITHAIEQGHTRFAVLPLFLAKGKHLKLDIPKKIAALESQHPITIRLLQPIGESPKLAATMIDIVNDALALPH